MENLTPEGKAIYETVSQASEAAHARHQKELDALIVAAVGSAVEAAVARSVGAAVDKAVDAAVSTIVNDMQAYTDGAEAELLKQIHELRNSKGFTSRGGDQEVFDRSPKGAADPALVGQRPTSTTRGAGFGTAAPYVPPPARVVAEVSRPSSSFSSLLHREKRSSSYSSSGHGKPPSVDFPRFDGENPKLWQTRCVDYFEMFDTDPDLWIAVASMQFEGAAARWLSSVQHKFVRSSWEEFCAAVLGRFGRNQHQSLVRKLYRLRQTGSVEDYVSQFSELMDQLTAYEPEPDMLHYTTRFMDGLKPSVRMTVAVQRPADLDTAYSIAAVHEEMGEIEGDWSTEKRRSNSSSAYYRADKLQVAKPMEEPKLLDKTKGHVVDDKLATLKAYRRAKGLCFICGERWGRDHKCNTTVQLHVVQEMLEFCALDSMDSDDSDMDLMVLSAEAQQVQGGTNAIRLECQLGGHAVVLLVDSGSSHSFISARLASHITGQQLLPSQQTVRIAGGGTLPCTHIIPACAWSAAGHEFKCDFKVLPLQHHDGIVGMDWLSSLGTMQVNWLEKWLAFDHHGRPVFLQGCPPETFSCTVVELHLVQPENVKEDVVALPAQFQELLDQYTAVFEPPTGLPPRRSCDHRIPLMEGARPVNIRPYRYSSELKSEIEKQVQEMLQTGVIVPSSSPFASPIIMVKKKDGSWRLCVDYRHLNLLTLKSKYPLPVIDELLDELTGASWFSKLDLRAGYHQIRLAPGEEYKTAFHTHNGHYEFTVLAFGLTGGPCTFQSVMNDDLAPVLREPDKCAVVFFDDILVPVRCHGLFEICTGYMSNFI